MAAAVRSAMTALCSGSCHQPQSRGTPAAPARSLRGRRHEIEVPVHVDAELPVQVHVRPEQRGQGSAIVCCQPGGPSPFVEYPLDHDGVDVDEGGLEEVKAEHGHLLALTVGTAQLPFPAVVEGGGGAVPALDHL